MKAFVTGGTGSIGGAVITALVARGHDVSALCRSAASAQAVEQAGAAPVPGDLREPKAWLPALDDADAVIHAGATWHDDMAAVDRNMSESVIEKLQGLTRTRAFIYTGGCWLYGATGDVVATEETPFDSLPEFAYSIPTIDAVLSNEHIRGMVIHPAMVYERDGGVFERIVRDVERLGYARIVGSETVRWPLVHRDDLGVLYALMMEKGQAGDAYNAATVEGMPIGQITQAIVKRLGCEEPPRVVDIESMRAESESTAAGFALDQQMSGKKAMRELGWTPRHLDVFADIG
jgi:nucleoside-diphosphate-sugar epimerase